MFPDRVAHDGAEHQHIWIDDLAALDDGDDYPENVFVAIRVTEGGIGRDIPFETGTPMEMQGLFIPVDQAQPGQDNEGLPVPHFTHAPVTVSEMSSCHSAFQFGHDRGQVRLNRLRALPKVAHFGAARTMPNPVLA